MTSAPGAPGPSPEKKRPSYDPARGRDPAAGIFASAPPAPISDL